MRRPDASNSPFKLQKMGYIRCLIDAAPSVGILQVSLGRLRPGGASSCASRPRLLPHVCFCVDFGASLPLLYKNDDKL